MYNSKGKELTKLPWGHNQTDLNKKGLELGLGYKSFYL